MEVVPRKHLEKVETHIQRAEVLQRPQRLPAERCETIVTQREELEIFQCNKRTEFDMCQCDVFTGEVFEFSQGFEVGAVEFCDVVVVQR